MRFRETKKTICLIRLESSYRKFVRFNIKKMIENADNFKINVVDTIWFESIGFFTISLTEILSIPNPIKKANNPTKLCE